MTSVDTTVEPEAATECATSRVHRLAKELSQAMADDPRSAAAVIVYPASGPNAYAAMYLQDQAYAKLIAEVSAGYRSAGAA